METVFRYNQDIRKNAYMNWRVERNAPIDNMVTIAEGYMMSAQMNIEELLKDNNGSGADAIIFPILFTVNHGIELYLKAINWSLNILLDYKYDIEGKHDIKSIFDGVKKKVIKYETDKEKKKAFEQLTLSLYGYIKELYGLLQKSQVTKIETLDFSRYPFDRDKNNHFYIETFDNVVVDMESFLIVLKEISKNLYNISTHYIDEVDWKFENH